MMSVLLVIVLLSLAVQNTPDVTDAPENDSTPQGMFVGNNTLNTQAFVTICGHRAVPSIGARGAAVPFLPANLTY